MKPEFEQDVNDYMATPGLGGEDDAIEQAEEVVSGYEDAPPWYWSLVGRFPGWRGDRHLWVTLLLSGMALGVIVGGCAAIVGFLSV